MALLLWSTLVSPVLSPPDAFCATWAAACENYLGPRATTTQATDTSPVFNTRYRSTIEILWSCLAIIFASTWICVHPNVTGYKATTWQNLWKRVKLFILAVLAPELLAVFAFFQWKGCRELHKAFREKAKELNISVDLNAEDRALQNPGVPTAQSTKTSQDTPLSEPLIASSRASPPEETTVDPQETAWTLTHANFVQMGGIVFKNPETREVGFKEPGIWKRKERWVDRERSWTDEDIKNFFALRLSEASISDRSKASALVKTLVVMQVLWFVVQTIARALEGLPITHLEVVCLAFTLFNVGMYACWWDKPLDVECPVEVEGSDGDVGHITMFNPITVPMGGLDNLPVGEWIYSAKTKLYPSLYCYHADHNERSFLNKYLSYENDGVLGGAFTLALSFTSASFGALHTIGWSLPSPSHAEHILWQISCLVLMSYPLLPLVIVPFIALLREHAPRWVGFAFGSFMAFITFCGAITYIGARFILLVLPFLELRNLPPLAHQTISWSNFLPHI
ncbi:hypothetical protein FA13DRAFT_1140705 [Coprinellus micaceus]|uniref:Uncharacterized protein n=1 Tax=Coprinellus micaceus TaxID=71717 RepID=A0A4Y7SVH2_COPMI|nr:hypothetical protein FA13DRAFT_1140705 [Coprinellus micaceus]